MKFSKQNELERVLMTLFERYTERVPDVKKITSAMVSEGIISNEQDIINDHIAFRTLGIEPLGIRSFEKIFMHYGYTKKDFYHFDQKKLNAYWYAPPGPEYPRVFLSELIVNDLSNPAQQIIQKYTQHIKADPVDSLNLNDGISVGNFLHKSLWQLPSLSDYTTLLDESEYAAWVIYNRYYLNHYTISVHNLKEGYNDLASFNTFLERIGIRLNTAGGKIKYSKDGLLTQSSSIAQSMLAEFSCKNKRQISGSYVEFAERKILPEYSNLSLDMIKNKHRRDGFETSNADKIFESTYTKQVNRKS